MVANSCELVPEFRMSNTTGGLLEGVACPVYAEQQYEVVQAIHYYEDSIHKKNESIDPHCVLDLYYPKGATNFATIIWFHGGGLTGGQREIPEHLMNKGCAIVGVEYRLSPTVKAPACIEDAAAATAWIFRHIQDYGGSNKLIFLSGHSAGSYLCLMLTLNRDYLSKYNIDANHVAGLISFSGQAITHFEIRKERGIKETQPLIDEYAPLYFVRKEAPPMLLITGDRNLEILGRYEENAYLWRMMTLVGHTSATLRELPGCDHMTMLAGAYPLLLEEVAKRSKELA